MREGRLLLQVWQRRYIASAPALPGGEFEKPLPFFKNGGVFEDRLEEPAPRTLTGHRHRIGQVFALRPLGNFAPGPESVS